MAKATHSTHVDAERDEVAEKLHDVIDQVSSHRNGLIIGIVAVLLVGLFGWAYVSHRQNVRQESSASLAKGLQTYAQLLNQNDESLRATTRDEIVRNADAAATLAPGSDLAYYANYLKGQAYFNTDATTQAQAAFEQCLTLADDPAQRARAEIALGYALENGSFSKPDKKQQYDMLTDALGHFAKAADATEKDSYLHNYALLSQARISELTAKNDKAVDYLKQVLANRPPLSSDKPSTQTLASGGQTDQLLSSLMSTINGYEDQLGLNATAKLRLDRLEANISHPASSVPTPAPSPVPNLTLSPGTSGSQVLKIPQNMMDKPVSFTVNNTPQDTPIATQTPAATASPAASPKASPAPSPAR